MPNILPAFFHSRFCGAKFIFGYYTIFVVLLTLYTISRMDVFKTAMNTCSSTADCTKWGFQDCGLYFSKEWNLGLEACTN